MKKLICIMLAFAAALSLCACSGGGIAVNDNNKNKNNNAFVEVPKFSKAISELSLGCFNKFGYYDVSGSLIHFYDSQAKRRIVLCNKPDCNHSNEECNAFITSKMTDSEDNDFVVNATASFMLSVGDRIYVFLTDGNVISMLYDGTQHRKEAKIDDKYSLDRAFLYEDRIYIYSYFSQSDGAEITEKACFIIYNLSDNEWEQGEAFDRSLSGDSLVGITKSGEAVFFSSDEVRNAPGGLSPSEAIAFQNKTKCEIYKTDMKTAERKSLMQCTLGDCAAIQMLDGVIYCHSQNDECLYSLSPENAERKTECEGISGEVLLDKSVDNHLVIASSKDFNSDESEISFFDVKTKKLTKAYELKSNLTWNNNFRGIIGETENELIMIYKADFIVEDEGADVPYVSDMKAYVGVIEKESFWSGKYDFEEIEWF